MHVFGEAVDPAAADSRWGCVVVAVADRAALRRDVESVPRLGRTRAVVAFLADASAPLVPDVRPEWPEPVELDAHLTSDGGAVTRLRFPSAVPVHEVLGQARRRRRLAAARRRTVASSSAGDDGPTRRCRRTCCAAGTPGQRVSGHRPTRRRRRAGGPVGRRRGGVQPDRVPTRRRPVAVVDLPPGG